MDSFIHLQRRWYTDESTIGIFTFDDLTLYSLEDTVRKNGVKIYGKTAIPSGRYEVVLTYSNRFKKLMPLLLNVPNFNGVRIHSGNKPEHTEGCILVGTERPPDQKNIILGSRTAFTQMMEKLEPAIHQGKIYIDITG